MERGNDLDFENLGLSNKGSFLKLFSLLDSILFFEKIKSLLEIAEPALNITECLCSGLYLSTRFTSID